MRPEIKIGLTVVTAILIAFTGFKILQDNPVFRPTHLLYTNFKRVDGLTSGSYIYVNGVKVGSVNSLELNEDRSVNVGLNFTDITQIPLGTEAYLMDMDFLGTKAIRVELGRGAFLDYGAEIPGFIESSAIDELTATGKDLMEQVDPTIAELNKGLLQLNEVLNQQNRNAVGGILSNVQEGTSGLSDILRENRQELQSSLSHINQLLGNLDTLTTEKRPALDSLITNLEASTRGIDELIASTDSLTNSLNKLVLKMESGEGSMAKLVNDSTLYMNVSDVSFELARMLKKMNDDPKYFFKHVKIRLF